MNWPMLTAEWNLKNRAQLKKNPTERDKQDQEDPLNERCLMICLLFPVCYVMCYQNG